MTLLWLQTCIASLATITLWVSLCKDEGRVLLNYDMPMMEQTGLIFVMWGEFQLNYD